MNKEDELVLVVPSDKLFEKGIWQGLKTDNLDYYLELIKNNCEFKRRGDVETDNSVQQIIPYILFSFENKFFAFKYLAKAGEQRLVNNNYQVGVGGHINKEDLPAQAGIDSGDDVVETGMMREWDEEVNFKGNLISKKLVGIINDDANPVEQVHLGLVYHFVGDGADIQIKEIDKMEGNLFEIQEIAKLDKSVWMNIVYQNYLSKIENV
jgi:predicted NUDIX family phosphoesterase